jgi:hypothetical protein
MSSAFAAAAPAAPASWLLVQANDASATDDLEYANCMSAISSAALKLHVLDLQIHIQPKCWCWSTKVG